MKIKHRLFAMLLAVMLCVTAFSMPAFAYADDGCTSEPTAAVPAETTVTDTTANSDENAGEDTAKLTPSGNLTLVDDIQTTESTSKQFITLQSKSGNTFYLVIDRSGDKENVLPLLEAELGHRPEALVVPHRFASERESDGSS